MIFDVPASPSLGRQSKAQLAATGQGHIDLAQGAGEFFQVSIGHRAQEDDRHLRILGLHGSHQHHPDSMS